MWDINAEIGQPIKGFQPVPEGAELIQGLHRISDEAMQFIHAHPFWLWDGITVVKPVIIEPVVPPKPPEQLQRELTDSLQKRLDDKAREHLYDDIKSLCTYLPDDPNPVYAAEGALGRVWRSDTWTVSTAVMMQVMAGQRGIPTKEELLALLMPLKWAGEE